jgi:hypothetical protein
MGECLQKVCSWFLYSAKKTSKISFRPRILYTVCKVTPQIKMDSCSECHEIILVFKCLKMSLPVHLRNMFASCWTLSIANTWSAQTDLRPPWIKSDSKANISYSRANLFNYLSLTIKLKFLSEFFLWFNYEVQLVNEFCCAICKHVMLC